jgi:quercetin dioxygenase-like cupin family protein
MIEKLCRIFGLMLPVLVFSTTTIVAQDPVAVAPDIYKVLLENERVRVLEQRLNPGDREPMHSHPAYVKYTISSYKATVTYRNQTTSAVRRIEPGRAMWFNAETHSQKNTGRTPIHTIIFELKGQQVIQPEQQEENDDPLVVDAKTHRKLLENERVRVIEFRLKPKESTALHHHRDGVFYVLKGGTISETLSNGTAHEVVLSSGDTKWVDAKSHKVKNTGATDIKMIIVELKD